MKVFLDTNVVLDFLLAREGFYEDARNVMRLGCTHACSLYMSSLSFSNIAYIARKKYLGESLYDLLSGLREFIRVTTVDQKVVDKALRSRARDFEDALQYFSALGSGTDILLTRNVGDYDFDGIAISTPKDFIASQSK